MVTAVARRTASASDIIDAATEVLAERGYAGTTLDRVAERFGITRQGVLHYFASKQELIDAVLERDRAWATEQWANSTSPESTSPLMALSVFVDTSAEALLRLRLLHVLRAEAIGGDPAAATFIHNRTGVIQANVRALVEQAAQRQGLRAGWTVPTATDAVIAIIDGLQTAALVRVDVDPITIFTLTINSIAASPLEGIPRAD